MNTAAIILNWNRADQTLRCARSVLASAAADLGLVIIDNGSDDGSDRRLLDWLAGYGEVCSSEVIGSGVQHEVFHPAPSACGRLGVILRRRNGGYAAGNNDGLRWAREAGARFAWILNNDTVVREDALREMERRAEEEPVAALVGSCVVDLRRPSMIQCFGGGRWSRLTTRTRPIGARVPLSDRARLAREFHRAEYIYGASMLCRVAAMAEIGDLPEDYFLFHEDHDCARALRRRGHAIAVAPRAVVLHQGGATSGSASSAIAKSPLAAFHANRSLLIFVRRWEPWWLPWVLAVRLGYAIALLVRRPPVGVAVLRGLVRGAMDPRRSATCTAPRPAAVGVQTVTHGRGSRWARRRR